MRHSAARMPATSGLGVAALCGLLLSGLAVGPAAAESARPLVLAASDSAAATARPETPSRRGDVDVLQQLGSWFDRSISGLNAGLHDGLTGVRQFGDHTRDALGGAAAAAGSTAASLASLPNARIVRRRELCQRAPNGGPDCQRASAVACNATGRAGGAPFEVQTEEKCPVEVLMGQRARWPGECTSETYVVQSLCQ